jgi:hypothetical protein
VAATKPTQKHRRDDEYRWRASTWRRRQQWNKWENVGLRPVLGLDDLRLRWVDPRIRGVDILGAASSITLERTMDGASTLAIVIKDPWLTIFSARYLRTGRTAALLTPAQRRASARRKLNPIEVDEGWNPIHPPYLRGRAAEVTLDGARFRLVKVSYSHVSQEATLTFEDLIVYLLKRKFGARRANRKKVTRAQFVLSQLREIKTITPPFICPELLIRQPVDKPDATGRGSTRTSSGGSGGAAGFSPNGHLFGMDSTGKRYAITGDKRRNATRVFRKADEITDASKPRLALAEAINIESQWSNPPGGDRDSAGILQVRVGLHGSKATNIEWCVERFLSGPSFTGAEGGAGAVELARKHPSWSAGRIAQTIQGSAYGSRYDKTEVAAAHIVRSWGGSGGSDEGRGSRGGGSYAKPYQYNRKKDESAYGSITRLAEEVGWRFFPVGEAVYFMSEEQLYNRRIRYTFRPGDDSILDLNYDVDWGKPVSQCTLQVNLDRWGAPPGAVVELEGWDVPDGRWLIASVRRDWFRPTAEVSLKQPGKAKLEPAAERVTRTSTSSSASGSRTDPDSNSKSDRLFSITKQFSGSYVYGGGHGPRLARMHVGDNLDCSSSTSLALYRAGMWDAQDTARVSGDFSNWGNAGRGDQVTVWYNAGHVFVQFSGDLRGRFDTGGPGGGAGPRYRGQERSTSGFTPRHWTGT